MRNRGIVTDLEGVILNIDYQKTFKKEPFPDDGKFGQPRKQLEFVYMEKQL